MKNQIISLIKTLIVNTWFLFYETRNQIKRLFRGRRFAYPLAPITIETWYKEELDEYTSSKAPLELMDLIGCYRLAAEHGYLNLARTIALQIQGSPDIADFTMSDDMIERGLMGTWIASQRMRGRSSATIGSAEMQVAVIHFLLDNEFVAKHPSFAHLAVADLSAYRSNLRII
jgi:hypothetical protein